MLSHSHWHNIFSVHISSSRHLSDSLFWVKFLHGEGEKDDIATPFGKQENAIKTHAFYTHACKQVQPTRRWHFTWWMHFGKTWGVLFLWYHLATVHVRSSSKDRLIKPRKLWLFARNKGRILRFYVEIIYNTTHMMIIMIFVSTSVRLWPAQICESLRASVPMSWLSRNMIKPQRIKW